MKPYFCVYDTKAPHFAWIFRDQDNTCFHNSWQDKLEGLPLIDTIADIIDTTSPEELISDSKTAAKYFVGYYPLNFTTEEFFQQHPELLI